jgi:hypothetical protein
MEEWFGVAFGFDEPAVLEGRQPRQALISGMRDGWSCDGATMEMFAMTWIKTRSGTLTYG